jgi:hypothetical protein
LGLIRAILFEIEIHIKLYQTMCTCTCIKSQQVIEKGSSFRSGRGYRAYNAGPEDQLEKL